MSLEKKIQTGLVEVIMRIQFSVIERVKRLES